MIPAMFILGKVLTGLLLFASIADFIKLWSHEKTVSAERHCAPRFSNGDDNDVRLVISNNYPFDVAVEIIDEIPVVFQRRDILFNVKINFLDYKIVRYKLRPTKRGEYGFGNILLYVTTKTYLVCRCIKCIAPMNITVYPSYVMLKKYEFMAIHNNLTELGIKKIRRIGYNKEFESIKEYIKGDDYRTINWKASARRNYPMINIYQDERSQQIYSIIDKGRIMQSSFNGMTLLDYAINASLALSFIAIHKYDKAGLATFADKFETFIPADKQTGQMQQILESLYRQQTTFGESDYLSLYININKFIKKRSLLIIYTNFETITGIERQLEYLRQLARRHVVITVFFEDTEMKIFANKTPYSIEGFYQQAIAEKNIIDKQHIIAKLKQHGIHTLLTDPDRLCAGVINKYLEMKAGGTI